MRCIGESGISGEWCDAASPEGLDSARGAYLLLLRLATAVSFQRGQDKAETLEPGWYLYAGSAWGGGGISARVCRHFRKEKKSHWHIDRLTLATNDISALCVPGRRECDLVTALMGSGRFCVAAPGFGSSDCRRCESHLLLYDVDSLKSTDA